MEKSWYFIQLSDTHIVAATHQEFHGVNTYDALLTRFGNYCANSLIAFV